MNWWGRQRTSVEPLALGQDFDAATALAKELLHAGTLTTDVVERLKNRFPGIDEETLACALGVAMAEVRNPS